MRQLETDTGCMRHYHVRGMLLTIAHPKKTKAIGEAKIKRIRQIAIPWPT
ncbi:hypothetical protein KGY77_08040 [Candidatus Bipolaricaulota bacterium]|nr:hypothetical protein [Candidatus Bipolaricaulota bacterium]